MNDFVIYTAIVGNYDEILQPLVVDNRFDYILFSDHIDNERIGVWQVRPIPYHNGIQTKIARWVKTHPGELLADYSCSLWMDANIRIVSSSIYERCVELFHSSIPIASVLHPDRKCIYDEAVCCMSIQIENELVALPWLHKIQTEGYPHDNGLTETNILFRLHQKTIHFDQLWWQCIEKYSRRDQLSFDYVLWKTGISRTPFFNEGISAHNSSWLEINTKHKNSSQKRLSFTPQNYPFLYHYKKIFPYKDYWNFNYNHLYAKLYKKSNPLMWARISGLFYWAWQKIWRSTKGKCWQSAL